jgi:hypothetical protein
VALWGLAAPGHGHAAEAPVRTPQFEVSAIVLEEGGVSWVLMAEPEWTQGRPRVVAPGGTIGPYRLIEVAADHVVMQGPAGVRFKVPFSWRGTAAGAPAAAHPAPASGQAPGRRATTRDDEGDEGRRAGRREPRGAGAPRGTAGDQAELSGTVAEPSLRELSRGLPPEAQAQIEEFIRRRERALGEEPANQGAAPRR